MNRRDFLKNVGASGMVAVAPLSLSTKASAETALTPVGQYFVFVHLGGGWEPTTFINPMGNEIRTKVGEKIGREAASIRNGSSPVNRYPASAIRRAADIYVGDASIETELKYAPYLGTYNFTGRVVDPENAENMLTVIDDGAANGGLTTRHIQKILSGDFDPATNTLTAESDATFNWGVSKTPAQIQATAKLIIESCDTQQNDRRSSISVDLSEFAAELENRELDNAIAAGSASANFFVYDAFVCLHADKMRVLNGVDNRTNSHSTGTQYADTGSMAMGYPDFSALYAAIHGPDRPLAWMTDGGGNDSTAGLVARSSASDADVFAIIADPRNNKEGLGMTKPFESMLQAAHAKRQALQAREELLPLRRQFQDELYLVRDKGDEFVSVADDINNPPPGARTDVKTIADAGSGRLRHMRIGAAGFESGLASSMQIGFGGFDTHGDHDNSHFPRIRQVLTDLHFLFVSLDAYQVLDQTTVIVSSDFGRTPWYNDGNGKDHWAVTSVMLFGQGVAGGSVVNATNGLIEALEVDPNSMQPDSSGIRITASHVHWELRKLAGISQDPLSLLFPVEAEDMSILG